MMYIRQGATHKVVVGPFVDVGDGFTPETGVTLSGADEAEAILHDNGTVVDISGYTWAAITTADGYYHLTLQSGISGTVGHLTIVVHDDSVCLPVRMDFTVLEEAVYDQLFAASAPGAASVAAVSDVESSLVIIKSDLVVIESDTTAIESELILVHSETTVIQSDTTAIEAAGGSLTAAQASQLSQAHSDVIIVGSDVIQIYSDTTAIEAGGGSLTAAQASQLSQAHSDVIIIGSDVVQVYSDTTILVPAVSDVESSLVIVKSDLVLATADIIQGTAQGGTVSDIQLASGAVTSDDQLNGATAAIISGTGAGQSGRVIDDSTAANDTCAISPDWDTAPDATSVYRIYQTAPASTDNPPVVSLEATQESQLTRVQSDLIVAQSDLLQVYSDTTLLVPGVSDVESSLVIVRSDLLQVYSDTTVIASDAVVLTSMVSDAESSLVVVRSDLLQVYSDTTVVEAQVAINGYKILLSIPDVVEKPESGTLEYNFRLHVRGPTGAMVDADSAPTINTLRNIGNDDLSGRLASATSSKLADGIYEWTYTSTSTDATEGIEIEIFVTIDSQVLNIFRHSVVAATGSLEATAQSILSDVALVSGAVSDVESSLVIVKSDLVVATSDTTAIETATSTAASDLAAIESELALVHSETTVILTQRSVPAKNAAFTFAFKMVDATDFATPETGLTVTATVSKDGAAFGAAAGTVTEIANGIYQMAATAADMNANVCVFRFTASGAAATEVEVITDGGV